MYIGYARVSTYDQNLDLQINALKEKGCKMIYKEKVSGISKQRPELEAMIEYAREGDAIVIWKLDRLGRSLKNLLEIVNTLNEKGIGLVSLHDPIDTTTSQGRLVFNLFASLAEFERELISERTRAGLTAARSRGRKGGRPKGLSAKAEEKSIAAVHHYKARQLSIRDICEKLGIAKPTFYRYLRHHGIEPGKENL
jgi:DNA invertase Pin-like site-specific DNA recombinase